MAKTPVSTGLCCSPITSAPLADSEAVELATVLKALADPVRLRLVSIIAAAGEGCACDFPEAVGKSQPTVSHHLTQLVNAGILTREKRGKWAWFKVNQERFDSLCACLLYTSPSPRDATLSRMPSSA